MNSCLCLLTASLLLTSCATKSKVNRFARGHFALVGAPSITSVQVVPLEGYCAYQEYEWVGTNLLKRAFHNWCRNVVYLTFQHGTYYVEASAGPPSSFFPVTNSPTTGTNFTIFSPYPSALYRLRIAP